MVTNQQRITRSLLVITLAALALVFLDHGVQAQLRGNSIALPPQPPDEPIAAFTRTVTITIGSGQPLTPALTSLWQTSYISFPVGPGGNQFGVGLPSDATDVTATVTCGTFDILTDTIQFTLTESICHFGYNFRTNQRVLRQGNQYGISQVAGSNAFFQYITTIIFTAPYEFVGFIGPTPMTITSDMLHWEQVVPENEPPFHRFRSAIWLADPRVARPDLQIVTASLDLDSSSPISSAHVAATIYNSSTMDSGAPTHVNLYDRLAPSTPPTGPLDLAGGWCGLDTTPACPSTATFTNPVPIIAAGETMTLTTDYTFAQCSRRDLYLQIDVFGGEAGLNLEADETNNRITLGQVYVPCLIHMPLIRK